MKDLGVYPIVPCYGIRYIVTLQQLLEEPRLSRVLRLPHLLFLDLPSADQNVPPTPSCSRLTGTANSVIIEACHPRVCDWISSFSRLSDTVRVAVGVHLGVVVSLKPYLPVSPTVTLP